MPTTPRCALIPALSMLLLAPSACSSPDDVPHHGVGTSAGSGAGSGGGAGAGGGAPAGPGAHRWSKRFGDAAGQQGTGIAVDAAGNVVVTGAFDGTVDFGTGPLVSAETDVFVAKFDDRGNPLWSKRWSGTGAQDASGIAVDAAGNVLLTGYFDGTIDFGGGPLASVGGFDIFVAKLDPKGGPIWSKRFGDPANQQPYSVAADSAGNVFLTGSLVGAADFGSGPLTSAGKEDVFIAKLDAKGGPIWSKRFGDGAVQVATDLAVDAAGNVVVTGYFGGTVDFGSGPLASAGDDEQDVFVAKFDAAGAPLWSKRFGGDGAQDGNGVAVDAAGDVLLAGYFQGTVDFGGGPLVSAGGGDIFVAKFDPKGAPLWSKRFGSAEDEYGADVAVDSAGNAVVTGFLEGTVDLGGGPLASMGANDDDVFVVKLDPTGVPLWGKRFGDADYQAGTAVAVDGVRNVLVTGYMVGKADFGGGPLVSAGGADIFLTKLAP